MARLTLVAAVLASLGSGVLAELKSCGEKQYDPEKYVCWDNQFLCPVVAGEPLQACAGACYSKFMYTCASNVLTLLPAVTTPFTLSVENPKLPIHGAAITASTQKWFIGGKTSTFCPSVAGSSCPSENITAMVAKDGQVSMDVMVPGGQEAYLDPSWHMAYTVAHSAAVPSGSLRTGFGAYQGGGFVNLNGNGWGWVACPASGDGASWSLVGKNATNADSLKDCPAINLKINALANGTFGAWQYE